MNQSFNVIYRYEWMNCFDNEWVNLSLSEWISSFNKWHQVNESNIQRNVWMNEWF